MRSEFFKSISKRHIISHMHFEPFTAETSIGYSLIPDSTKSFLIQIVVTLQR